jgi:hypothetical protein
MPVLIDGGFRRGTDIFKALALGADAVCVGRPYLYGLGAFGEQGVAKVLAILDRARRSMQSPTTSVARIKPPTCSANRDENRVSASWSGSGRVVTVAVQALVPSRLGAQDGQPGHQGRRSR